MVLEEEDKGGKWWGVSGEDGSGGSRGIGCGGSGSPAENDEGDAAETVFNGFHGFCIGVRVRESLTFCSKDSLFTSVRK